MLRRGLMVVVMTMVFAGGIFVSRPPSVSSWALWWGWSCGHWLCPSPGYLPSPLSSSTSFPMWGPGPTSTTTTHPTEIFVRWRRRLLYVPILWKFPGCTQCAFFKGQIVYYIALAIQYIPTPTDVPPSPFFCSFAAVRAYDRHLPSPSTRPVQPFPISP